MTNRLPVLEPQAPPEYGNYIVFYRDLNSDGSYSEPRERECLTLVTQAQAEKIAGAWQAATWVQGRVYGARKMEQK